MKKLQNYSKILFLVPILYMFFSFHNTWLLRARFFAPILLLVILTSFLELDSKNKLKIIPPTIILTLFFTKIIPSPYHYLSTTLKESMGVSIMVTVVFIIAMTILSSYLVNRLFDKTLHVK